MRHRTRREEAGQSASRLTDLDLRSELETGTGLRSRLRFLIHLSPRTRML